MDSATNNVDSSSPFPDDTSKMNGEQQKASIVKNDNASTTAAASATCLVPQLSSHGISQADLETAVRVLNALASLDPKYNKNKKKKKQNKQKAANKKRRKMNQDDDDDKNTNSDDDTDGDTNNDDNDNDDDTASNNTFLQEYQKPNLRPLRKALASCLSLHRQTMFQGKHEEEHYELRKQERSLKRQKTAEKAQYKKYIASTTLRQGRVEKLQQLMQQNEYHNPDAALLLIPDGHVETETRSTPATTPLLTNGPTTASASTCSENEANGGDGEGVKLPQLRSCYVCKIRYRDLHHFYDQLCPSCAALNWQKRHATCNLSGRVAVVTGSRVKIGYQTVLKLLRANCHVVATTRFPQTAAAAFRKEADFNDFAHLLDIYGLDLRDVTGLEAFTRYLKQQHKDTGIDILINNACQTVRRPVAYYKPLVKQEQTLWEHADEIHKSLLKGCREFEHLRRKLLMSHQKLEAASVASSGSVTAALGSNSQGKSSTILKLESGSSSSFKTANATNMEIDEEEDDGEKKLAAPTTTTTSVVLRTVDEDEEKEDTTISTAPFESTGLSHSAAMSQTILLPEDAGVSDSVLPPGVTDVNGQQLDLRTTNSWLLKMEEVSTPEVMECMFINAIAPFVLNSRLKPLMTIPHDDEVPDERKRRPDRYIINVSAMEGKFYRYKMPNHPHTNMAKAALNMLTRTSAEDLATKHRIFMNSVDTGWINDENPLQKASQTAKQNSFQTPIDEVDAAARILDPIFVGVNDPNHAHDYGKFLKDYRETEW